MERAQIDRIAEDLLDTVPQVHGMVSGHARRAGHDQASGPQIRLLAALLPGPQTISALARQQHVSPQAVGDLAHTMVGRGWLSRAPNERDRRKQLLSLTRRGQLALAEAREQALRQITPHLDGLSDTELHVLAAALPTLQRVLRQLEHSDPARGDRPERRPAE